MARFRRESRHSDGITNQKILQRTSATKSAQSGHPSAASQCPLLGVQNYDQRRVDGFAQHGGTPYCGKHGTRYFRNAITAWSPPQAADHGAGKRRCLKVF
jgi:hypothetical protein